jgi:hypothetical protein
VAVEYRPVTLPVPNDAAGATRAFVSFSVTVPGSFSQRFFLGPKDFDVLRDVEPQLVRAIDFGMFAALVVPLLLALKWINGFVNNYGWSIVVLTILINLVIFPLRHRSMVSMRKMQALQPEIKSIQDRYAKYKITDPERQKMNQEMMALYKQKGVNPALHGMDSRPFNSRPALHHAGAHGPDAVLADAHDADDGRSGSGADVHDDADHLHGHLPVVPGGPGALLVREQPSGDWPAVPDQSHHRWPGRPGCASGSPGRQGQSTR